MPNKITFLNMLSLHQTELGLSLVNRLHSFLLSIGLHKDVSIVNALIYMHGKCNNLKTASLVFDACSERDLVSWTTMMSVLCQQGLHKDCHLLFEQMQRQGIIVDQLAFVTMITAFTNVPALHKGKLIHSHAVQSNLESTIDVANALLNMYGKCGTLDDALQILNKMQIRNKQTYINILSACANLVALSTGKQIHSEIIQKGILLDGLLGNNLINMYGKCGCVLDAQSVFDKMENRDVISWSTMITSYAQNGQGKLALALFDRMKHEEVWPNEVTFLGVLSACNHTGLVDDCYHHLISMSESYGISPLEDHYTCVTDLLSRSGRLDEAEDMISKMPRESRSIPCMALLGACLFRVDVARAERVAKEVFMLEPMNPTPYVMLANVYASAGREEDAAKLLIRMQQNGLHDTSRSNFNSKNTVQEQVPL
jgi:pentatricopeptide repeat protein